MHRSVTEDVRCDKFYKEARDKGRATKVCYNGPLLQGYDKGSVDSNPVACNVLYDEAEKKCNNLPKDPDSIIQVSGSATYRGGRPVMIDGKPVYGLPYCDECKECNPIE